MKRLDEVFDVWYGVNLEVVNSEVVEKDVPFVSRQSVNNGIVCHVRRMPDVSPNPANTLSIAVSGSVLSTFYHDYEYYSGRDVYVAKPKLPLTKAEMLYYCSVIEHNKYRYNYGRGANRTFKGLLVPSYEEIPDLVKRRDVNSDFIETPLSSNKLQLNTKEWKWFKIGDYFDKPYKATAYNAIELISCPKENKDSIAYITRTDTNNGCKDYVINEGFNDIENGNAITIGDTTATIYYQENDFICGDHMVVLRSSLLNKYVGLFITSLLNKERFRYNYGRAFNKGIISDTKLKLPAILNTQGEYEPDWQWMEDYIKGLPYSGCL